jgi:capsular exopolysaccharide synthesis family protein
MEINRYIKPLLKWWWLLVAAMAVAAAASFWAVRRQPVVYLSRTTLIVGTTINNPNPSSGDFYMAQYLAGLYADIANREPLRDATRAALNIDWLPSYGARAVPNSQMIEIVVTSSNPEVTQIVANELAHQLILRSPTSNTENQERLAFINEQLSSLRTQIKETQKQVEDLQQQLVTFNSARQISDAQNQIDTLIIQINTLQSTYASLLAGTPSGAANTLTVIEPASTAYRVSSNKMIPVILAIAIGFILAAGAIYLMEYLDRTVKTPEDVSQHCQASVIGYISEMERSLKHATYVAERPRSPIAEAFRSLRTNLEFAGVDEPMKTILFTSTDPGDGKTVMATNLALTLAQTEKKVILVDCDLRKPNVYRALGIKSRPGLSEIFREHSPILEAIQLVSDKNLGVLTAGSVPPNPAELLSSNRMKQILSTLSEMYDFIIIDSAPMMTADTQVLSSQIDGVVLVTRYAHTTGNSIQNVVDQFKRANARIAGVVINRIPRSNARTSRFYTSSYYDQTDENRPAKAGRLEGHLTGLKSIAYSTSKIKNIFHKQREEEEIDLVSEDYLFNRIASDNDDKDKDNKK